jgi:hypothetical protein
MVKITEEKTLGNRGCSASIFSAFYEVLFSWNKSAAQINAQYFSLKINQLYKVAAKDLPNRRQLMFVE